MTKGGYDANPLSLVLQAIDEPLEILRYNAWNVVVPELPDGYSAAVGPEGFDALLLKAAGAEATQQQQQHAKQDEEAILEEFRALQAQVAPLSSAAVALPPAAIRLDIGVVFSIARYLPKLLPNLLTLPRLTAPFSTVLDNAGVKNAFLRNYIDLLCFLLSGLPASGTITAEVAFMMKEWFDKDATLEFPRGGSQALADALVRGVTKHKNGKIYLNCHVERIEVDAETNRATGVVVVQAMKNGKREKKRIKAAKAVVSNASTIDTVNSLLNHAGSSVVTGEWAKRFVDSVPLNPSFMHLHLGFDATGLGEGSLGLHHIVVFDWKEGVTAPGNVVLISIASVIDPSLAPPGKHCLHAYYPATEPSEPWEKYKATVDSPDKEGEEGTTNEATHKNKKEQYEAFKKERAQRLWQAVEKIIPDIRKRVDMELIGSPLTHARYLRRHQGSYGPAYKAGEAVFPFGNSVLPVHGLYCVGDFCFPGIGLPAVAASGAVVANTLMPLRDHFKLLDKLGL